MNLIIMFGCSKGIKPDSNEKPIVTAGIKGICISTGQANTFTEADYLALGSSPLTDFIIIPGKAEDYGQNEAGYKSQLGTLMATVINQLVAHKSTAKIWIGTPGITSNNYSISDTSLDPMYNFLSYIRDQVGTTVWANNVGGVYMNEEAIYGTVDYNNIYANPCIKLMNDLSIKVHNNLNTKFFWIPYFGYGSNPDEIIKRIGYVANNSTIFDYVVIQPHYYFDASVGENIQGVKYCISKQSICYRDGTVVTPKISQTVIGPEMELDWHVVPPNNYTDFLDRYLIYVKAFTEFKGSYPIIFYWDGTFQAALSGRINTFFQ